MLHSSKSNYVGPDLYFRLAGIGFRFAVCPIADSQIEDTIIAAGLAAIKGGDRRLAIALLDWWPIHNKCINAHVLFRKLKKVNEPEISAFFSSLAQSTLPKNRFRKLANLYHGPRVLLFSEDYRYRLGRDGEVERFERTSLAVPKSLYQESERDIMSPFELAAIHREYHWRLTLGTNYWAKYIIAFENRFRRVANWLEELWLSLADFFRKLRRKISRTQPTNHQNRD